MEKLSELKKLAIMGKLITLGFTHYKLCNNNILNECVLNETQVEGINRIKTEIRMFKKQRDVAFESLINEDSESIKFSLKIFRRDVEHLKKFLELCRERHTVIEKALFEPLKEYIEELKDIIEILREAFPKWISLT